MRALRINAFVDALFGAAAIPFIVLWRELSHVWLGVLGSLAYLASGALKWWVGDGHGELPASTRALCSVYVVVGGVTLELFFGVGTSIAAPVGLCIAAHAMTDTSPWPRRVIALYILAHIVEVALHNHGLLPFRDVYWSVGGPASTTFLVGHFGMTLVYVGAYALGRYMQRENQTAQHELTEAVRLATLTDALLNEARAELEGRLLGRGGMGEVYDAVSEHGEPAAVKVLRFGRRTLDGCTLARFERESQILSSVDSPHLVKVFEVGDKDSEFPYIAMERLAGQDLETYLLRYGELPSDEVLQMALQVAEALSAAHALGVIHRDLKPANIFRTTGAGVVSWRVLDFGVAGLRTNDHHLTADHQVGTVGYMAPEQSLEGAVVDERADVYGLAMLVLESATLFTPTLTDLDRSLGAWSPDAQARLQRALDEVPLHVACVLRSALSPRPADRPASCAAFARALERAFAQVAEEDLARPPDPTESSGSLTPTDRHW